MKNLKQSIGILGGSFDPPHRGHLKISLVSIKKFELNKLYWMITQKNPFKNKPFFSLKERLEMCKKMTKKRKKIKIQYLEKYTKSTRTIKMIEYLKTLTGVVALEAFLLTYLHRRQMQSIDK